MGKKATAYIWLVILVGIPLGVFCAMEYSATLLGGGVEHEKALRLIWLVALCAICRSFPIYMRDDQALDLTIISILVAYLTMGMEATVFAYLLSSFLSFERQRDSKKTISIYNTSLLKTLFNNSNGVISIVVSAKLCELTSWTPGSVAFPMVAVVTLLFSIGAFLSNSLVALNMFAIRGELSARDVVKTLISLTPNVLAAVPLGLLMALFFSKEDGQWMVFLMLAPLMLARYTWRLYLESQFQQSRLMRAFISTMEAKDEYTQGHSKRVEQYAVQVAQEMKLTHKQIDLIHEGAVLHDIGKIGIDERILRKPARLEPEEYQTMRQHPLIGVAIAEQVGLDKTVIDMIRCHHERYDGGGYPDGLKAEQISQMARILCVADAFDAMISDRPYRKGMPTEQAVGILCEEAGRQFDPVVVNAFMHALEKKKCS